MRCSKLSESSSQAIVSTNIGPPLGPKQNIIKAGIEKIAIAKFRSSGYGLTHSDVQEEYSVDKKHAQRSLKHLHCRGALFTAADLRNQGVHLLVNKNPQQYFPACIKGEILEKIRKRKYVQVKDAPCPGAVLSSGQYAISNILQYQKAQNFLEVLWLLPFTPPYIHKLFLILNINRQAYTEIEGKKKSRIHEELIGKRFVKYTLSSNGTIQIAVRSNDSPFKLESEIDEHIIFSFFGQVKDRLLYLFGDVKELVVPPVMEWTLKQCDLNKDIEIDEKAQLTLPDIQLKYACRVFREYVKIIEGKAYCRAEESLKFDELLPVALDNIRRPFKSMDSKFDEITIAVESLRTELRSQHSGSIVEKQANEQDVIIGEHGHDDDRGDP